MDIETLKDFLGICSLINIALLFFWFIMISQKGEWAYNLHSRWFNLSKERFDEIHYKGLAFYKISIYFFNIIPYIVLVILT